MSSAPDNEQSPSETTGKTATREISDPDSKPESESDNPDKKSTGGKKSNKKAYSFVIIFIVTVLTLLIGYRFAVPTPANDWYLLQVAKHTTIALDLIGERATLEEGRPEGSAAQEIRAQRQAWREGREEATADEIEAMSATQLSPWENWAHRAQEARLEGGGQQGPRVSFVWQSGIYRQIRDLEATIRTESTADSAWPESEAGQAAQERMRELREAQQTVAGADEGRKRLRGDEFTFVVIPECGAIEIMAIFFAAVIAFPTRWWKRLLGVLLGLPVMYAVNVFRLAVLAFIGAVDHSREWFDFTHEYIWQTVYIIFVIVSWLLWVELIVRRGPAKPGKQQ